MKSIDVFISGAGISGTITALLLADLGLNIVIADPYLNKQTPAHKSSRTTALMNESLTILERAGLYDAIKDNSEDLKTLTIIDESIKDSKSITETFHAREMEQIRFGRNIFVNDLQSAALIKAKKHKHISFIDSEVKSLSQHTFGITITMTDNKEISAKLLIGADGRASRVRELLGIHCWTHDYDQTAITGILSCTKPHHNTSTEFHREGGPLTFVPLPEQQLSFVWMERTDDATKLLPMTKDEFTRELQTRSQNLFGRLELKSHLESWPISVSKAREFTAPRTALIAETIHVLSPIGAQGLNLSLRDIDDLVSSVQESLELGLDIGSQVTLNKYKKRREFDVQARVSGTDLLNRFVQMTPTPLKQIRRIGLKIAGNFIPVRNTLMREGLRGKKTN
jgi:2-octaprenyl-6-methoxyphenol hydroxylase